MWPTDISKFYYNRIDVFGLTAQKDNQYKSKNDFDWVWNWDFAYLICSPAFSKLEEWLENLKMHLDIGLPLVSEVSQLHKTFWENHNITRSENGLHVHPEQPE